MLGAGGVGGDVGEVHLGGGHAGKLDFRLFRRLDKPLVGHLVLAQVDAVCLAELLHQVIHQALVEVVATQVVVTSGGLYLLDAIPHFDDRDVKGTASQVVDHNELIGVLPQAVGQSGGGRLIDDALHFQTGDAAGVLGGLALSIGEVGGNGDDCLAHRLAQIGLGIVLHLLEYHGGDLLGGVALSLHRHPVVGAHLALDGADGALRVGDSLALGDFTHQALAAILKGHHRGGGAVPFRVGDDDGFAALHYSHAAVGCTQVDANNLAHISLPPLYHVTHNLYRVLF